MISSVAAPSAGLDTLPARPPTPPRERQANPSNFDSKLVLSLHPRASCHTIQTPPSHSPDSTLSTNASSRRSRKRVEFTVQAEYCEPPSRAGKENEHLQSTPLSAPSSTGRSKPLKSILKPTSSPILPNPLDPSAGHGESGSATNLPAMLESTIKQLAGNDRDSRVDAYTMLVRALKTSTNVPDRIALQSKMSLFLQFIQRDITSKNGNTAIDYSLVNHALTLLSTFLHFPAIATAVTSDFGVFIIDHCIRSFEDYAVPKEVVRHLMQVVACQNFSSKVMTADRVGRLIVSLHHIEDHIKGKSIIMSRILIYRRLIRQSAIHMVSHTEWLLDLFTDMLSSLKSIRTAAIGFGLEASFTVAKEPQLPKKVMEILQMTTDETCYVEYYIQRLTAMTKEKSEMDAVPQIWSIVILLLRCPIDRWEFFDQWLEIIQRCFNSGDYQTKIEANYAWNRLIYLLHLYESSFSKTIGTLCQPFNQLRRRGKQPDELRRVVIGGLCNLYYYAFKPKSSSSHADYYWDACVKTLIRTLAFPDPDAKLTEKQQVSSIDNLAEAANILAGLFDSSTGRLWKEDRVSENPLAIPADLPPLDPKWIRRNTARVFAVVEPIIQNSFLNLADPESSCTKLWGSLIGSIAAAAAKEVKVSADTAGFLGNALSLLMRIWASGLREVTDSAAMQRLFLKATETYLSTMVLSIGHLPFTEKVLSMNKQAALVPIATPSRLSGKGQGPTRAPLHHLFAILSSLPPGISDSQDMSDLFKAVFGPFILTRSPRAKRDLAQELMEIPSSDRPISFGSWVIIAEALSTPVDPNQLNSSSTDYVSQHPIGHEFRDIVKHLERGISYTPNLPWHAWLSLFNFVTNQVTELGGEVSCSIAVIEPLAKAILDNWQDEVKSVNSNIYNCCTQLICCARQPRDRQALDFARKRLWGTAAAGARTTSFDPFDGLYRLTSRLLEVCYTKMDVIDDEVIVSLLSETSHYLSRSNKVLVFKSLVHLQQGIGPWIQDADEWYGSKKRSTVAESVNLLWDRICNLFSDTPLENFQLDAIEPLLNCAFKSKHRHIVNNVVLLWNKGFENATEVQYPERLKTVLLSLRPYIDIALPGLELSEYDTNAPAPSFLNSQDDLDNMSNSRQPGQSMSYAVDRPSSEKVETPKSSRVSLSDHNKSGDMRSRSRSNRSAKRSKASKLRHDDSQIQFTSIEQSSPLNQADESQVLTERQKEVRERQMENATLFTSIHSSPQKDNEVSTDDFRSTGPQRPDMIQPSLVDRSATPKGNSTYDYVSSTPTPRRGQPSMLDEEHEMTDDIPSSPPEPRRNLLPEMKCHSRDTRILDDMPISSSPVTGSPVSKLASRPPAEQLVLQGVAVGTTVESTSRQGTSPYTHDVTALRFELSTESSQALAQNRSATGPITQQDATPIHFHSPNAQAEPKSDNEVFMDALTSPVLEIPTRGSIVVPLNHSQQDDVEFKDRSFEMSYDEERSMARLVIELDSKKCEDLPDYAIFSGEEADKEDPAIECIINPGSQQGQKYTGERKSTEPLTPVASRFTETDMPRSSGKRSGKKRKRVSEKKHNSGGKRRKHKMQTDNDSIMKSQVAPVDNNEAPPALGAEPNKNDEVVKGDGCHDIRPPGIRGSSPDLTCDPGSRSHMEQLDPTEDSDVAAANLQLMTEASQQSDAEDDADFAGQGSPEPHTPIEDEFMTEENVEMDGENKSELEALGATEKSAAAPTEQSMVDRIKASLKDALEGLRTATVSREDVYKIEDMFMDIKAELYGAERRGRR